MNHSPITTIESVRYADGVLFVTVSGGGALAGATASFEARSIRFFKDATDEQLSDFRIIHDGHMLHFPTLDAEFPLSSLLNFIFGINNIARAASLMGARGGVIGGAARTEAKQAASRANGAKGGRPRKKPPTE